MIAGADTLDLLPAPCMAGTAYYAWVKLTSQMVVIPLPRCLACNIVLQASQLVREPAAAAPKKSF